MLCNQKAWSQRQCSFNMHLSWTTTAFAMQSAGDEYSKCNVSTQLQSLAPAGAVLPWFDCQLHAQLSASASVISQQRPAAWHIACTHSEQEWQSQQMRAPVGTWLVMPYGCGTLTSWMSLPQRWLATPWGCGALTGWPWLEPGPGHCGAGRVPAPCRGPSTAPSLQQTPAAMTAFLGKRAQRSGSGSQHFKGVSTQHEHGVEVHEVLCKPHVHRQGRRRSSPSLR